MKKNLSIVFLFVACIVSLTSCQAIGDLMKASFWGGAIVVIVIIALVLWLISKARK